jgi:hypothetical protein
MNMAMARDVAEGLLATLQAGRADSVPETMIATNPYPLGAKWKVGEIVNLNSFGEWRVTRMRWSKEAGVFEYFGVPHVPRAFDAGARK